MKSLKELQESRGRKPLSNSPTKKDMEEFFRKYGIEDITDQMIGKVSVGLSQKPKKD